MRRMIWALALVFLAANSVPAQKGEVNARPGLPMDEEHARWIQQVMHSIETIKPGMRRGEILLVFTEDGGLSTRSQQRYTYKHCPYIKVDVEFSPIDHGTKESPDDKIVKVSRPYLQYPIFD
jgi:hypothetical protein